MRTAHARGSGSLPAAGAADVATRAQGLTVGWLQEPPPDRRHWEAVVPYEGLSPSLPVFSLALPPGRPPTPGSGPGDSRWRERDRDPYETRYDRDGDGYSRDRDRVRDRDRDRDRDRRDAGRERDGWATPPLRPWSPDDRRDRDRDWRDRDRDRDRDGERDRERDWLRERERERDRERDRERERDWRAVPADVRPLRERFRLDDWYDPRESHRTLGRGWPGSPVPPPPQGPPPPPPPPPSAYAAVGSSPMPPPPFARQVRARIESDHARPGTRSSPRLAGDSVARHWPPDDSTSTAARHWPPEDGPDARHWPPEDRADARPRVHEDGGGVADVDLERPEAPREAQHETQQSAHA